MSSASLISLVLWMSKRRRGQKTLTEKVLLGPLVQMWYRRTTLINPTTTTTRRRTSKRTPQGLNRQPILRRRTREIALSTVILVISLVNVRTASGRAIKNQQIWLLVKLLEHRGMVIYYLQFFQSVIHLNDGLIPVLIYMCVLIYPCFHLIRLEGLDPC
jgi:hypothetical protein